jgi:hypothetical protein
VAQQMELDDEKSNMPIWFNKNGFGSTFSKGTTELILIG